MPKRKAPGIEAEEKFEKKLQNVVGSILTENEKLQIIELMKEFNTVHHDFFKNRDINGFLHSDIKIIKVQKVGANKTAITNKNDHEIIFDYKLSNGKNFTIGISYKDGQAQTIQSWSSNETWETIFKKIPKHYIENICRVVVELSNIQAREVNDKYFIGSTIHLKPLEHPFHSKIKPGVEEKMIQEYREKCRTIYPTEDTVYIDSVLKNIQEKKKLEYQLDKYVNKLLKINPNLLHYIIFGDKEESCLLYYRKVEERDFHSISDLFKEKGKQLFICGKGRNSAVRKLTDCISVSVRYPYPETSVTNQRMQYLVIWNLNPGVHNIDIYNSQQILVNGKYIPYYEFKKKHKDYHQYTKLHKNTKKEIFNFIQLKDFYQKKYNIRFVHAKRGSKVELPELPSSFTYLDEATDLKIKEQIEFLIISFMFEYNEKIIDLFNDTDLEFYFKKMKNMKNNYKTPTQKKKLLEFFRTILKKIDLLEKGELDITKMGRMVSPGKGNKEEDDDIIRYFLTGDENVRKKRKL